MAAEDRDERQPGGVGRRSFLSRATSLLMAGGLAAGYGAFAAIAARYLYPARPDPKGWLFVTDVGGMKVGESLTFRTPGGALAAVARQRDTGEASDFVALSSTCPHLGCQVHWQPAENRFFCPCHGGAFDPSGKATAGPPFEAGQALPRYPLKIEKGLLFIEAPLDQTAGGAELVG